MCGAMISPRRILRALKRNGPARRNLFGPVDRDQLRLDYQSALREDLDKASRRWGFDFISDKPLENDLYQWESVPSSRVPSLYRCPKEGAGQAGGQKMAETKTRTRAASMEKENIPQVEEDFPIHLNDLEKTPSRRGESAAMKRKQTNITDFYQAKRRVVGMPRKSGE